MTGEPGQIRQVKTENLKPQDPNAQDKPVSKGSINWAAFGINTEAFGKRTIKKRATDTPPTDVQPQDVPKLPPDIIEHNEQGETTGQHSAADERFAKSDAEKGIKDAASTTQHQQDSAPVNQSANQTTSKTPTSAKPDSNKSGAKTNQTDASLKVR